MIALLLAACWCFIAMLAGLVTGIHFLYVFGAAGFVVFGLLAWLLDFYSRPPERMVFRETDWDWPDRKDEAA